MHFFEAFRFSGKVSFNFASMALIAGATLIAGPALAVSIDFDGTGAPGNFIETIPLTTEYSAQGVTFSGVKGAGGSILNQSSNFGVNARSGTDFLSYSTLSGTGSGLLTFSSLASNFGIYVGSGGAFSYTADYLDADNKLIDSQTIVIAGGVYGKLARLGTFSSVKISSSGSYFVADDLSFDLQVTSVPEPATWALMIGGFGMVGGAMRRRQAGLRVVLG